MGNICTTCVDNTTKCISPAKCGGQLKVTVKRKYNKNGKNNNNNNNNNTKEIRESKNKPTEDDSAKPQKHPLIVLSGLLNEYPGVTEFFENNRETFKRIYLTKLRQGNGRLEDLTKYAYHFSYPILGSPTSFAGPEAYETLAIRKVDLQKCYDEDKYPLIDVTEECLVETGILNPETVPVKKVIKQFLSYMTFSNPPQQRTAEEGLPEEVNPADNIIFYFLSKTIHSLAAPTDERRFLDQVMSSPNFYTLDDTECINQDLLNSSLAKELGQMQDVPLIYRITEVAGLCMVVAPDEEEQDDKDGNNNLTPANSGNRNDVPEFEIACR